MNAEFYFPDTKKTLRTRGFPESLYTVTIPTQYLDPQSTYPADAPKEEDLGRGKEWTVTGPYVNAPGRIDINGNWDSGRSQIGKSFIDHDKFQRDYPTGVPVMIQDTPIPPEHLPPSHIPIGSRRKAILRVV